MDLTSILLRFFIVFIAAFLFGLDRQRAHKPVGFCTYIFVAMGSCGLSILGMDINDGNPIPIIGAIVTGIGFLGAGALIKTTDKIFGFTSAASIWIFSIIGLTVGIGEYIVAGVMYASVWIVFIVDNSLESSGRGSYQKKLSITANTDKNYNVEDLIKLLGTTEFKVISMDSNKKDNKFTITLYVEGSKQNINFIPKKLYKTEWVEAFKME